MDDYLNKPLVAAELWAAIKRVTTDRTQGTSDSSSLLSPSVLLAACGEDAEMLRTMCRSFSVRAPEHLARIERALRDRDAATLREAAHKFNGLLSAFSTPAGELAASLEDLAAESRLDEARSIVERLRTIVPALVGFSEGLTLETLRKLARAAGEPQSRSFIVIIDFPAGWQNCCHTNGRLALSQRRHKSSKCSRRPLLPFACSL